MNLLPGLRAVGQALYVKEHSALVIGDLHLGIEDELVQSGVFLPRVQIKDILTELNRLITDLKPKHIVLLGDLKHEFGRISRQEWSEIPELLRHMSNRMEVIALRGNHDLHLDRFWARFGLHLKSHHSLGEYLFCHGDKVNREIQARAKASKTVVIGHVHPAVSFRRGSTREKFKCFLVGKYGAKNLVVLPSFSPLSLGVNILEGTPSSPFIRDYSRFKIFACADKIYYLGTVSELRSIEEHA